MPDDNTKLCYKKHSGSAIAAYASTSNFVLALDLRVERLIEKSFHWSKALFHVSLHLNYCWIVFPFPRTRVSLETDCISFMFISSMLVMYVSSLNSLSWLMKNHPPSNFSIFFQKLAPSVFFLPLFYCPDLKRLLPQSHPLLF